MDKLRAQNVKIVLKVPVGKIIYLSTRMEKIIFSIDNINDAFGSDMTNRRWIMTNRGLECIDCSGLENVTHKTEAIALPPAPPTPPIEVKK